MYRSLPNIYQEVEYLQGTGKQFITLPTFSFDNKTVRFATRYINDGVVDRNAFGQIKDTINRVENGIGWLDKSVSVNYGNCALQLSGDAFPVYSRHDYEYTPIKLIIDGKSILHDHTLCSTYSGSKSSWGIFNNSFLNLRLFGTDRGDIKHVSSCIIYYFKIIDDNEKVLLDLVPCYRKSDKVAGMYDTISGTFYINQSSNSDPFIVGQDIYYNEVNEYIPQEIDWTDSMEQSFEYYEVDYNTWKDKKRLDTIKVCTINRDDSVDTLGSASIDVTDLIGESYIRIYLLIRQNGNNYKFTLGTFLTQTPSSTYDGKNRNITIDSYTPLLELKENPPPLGYALVKGDNIMKNAYQIVREYCRAPVVETTSDEELKDGFVADPEETWISYVRDLIAQAKYKLDVDEEGKILFAPVQKIEELQPKWTFNDDNSSILMPEVTLRHDLYGIPNAVEVICSTGLEKKYAKVVNDDPNSPTSTINRGREILHRVTDPSLPGYPTQEQLEEYARITLENLSSVEYQVSYTHGYCPVRIGDCVRLNYNRADLQDVKAKVISQSIKCSSGCQVSETAVFTKKLWK